MKWYYALNNQRHGPVSESEFDFLVHQGKILPDMLVWNETLANWLPLREVIPPEPPPYVPEAPVASQIAPGPDGPAWEERDSMGGIKAAVLTVVELLRSPDRAFARMKRLSDWPGPFCYALFFWEIAFYANLVYLISSCRVNDARWPLILLRSDYFAGSAIIFSYFFIPFAFAASVLVNSLLIHFFLWLAGGATQPFQATYRVVCYSLGTSAVLQIIPVAGPAMASVFNLVLLVAGISRMHDIPRTRAVLALAPLILFTALALLIWLGLI